MKLLTFGHVCRNEGDNTEESATQYLISECGIIGPGILQPTISFGKIKNKNK
jgi:hypothetical protein